LSDPFRQADDGIAVDVDQASGLADAAAFGAVLDVIVLAVAGADREIAGVAAAVEGAIGLLGAEAS
jgi:hypothetical protein